MEISGGAYFFHSQVTPDIVGSLYFLFESDITIVRAKWD